MQGWCAIWCALTGHPNMMAVYSWVSIWCVLSGQPRLFALSSLCAIVCALFGKPCLVCHFVCSFWPSNYGLQLSVSCLVTGYTSNQSKLLKGVAKKRGCFKFYNFCLYFLKENDSYPYLVLRIWISACADGGPRSPSAHLDRSLVPPSPQAEIFRRMCLQSHL